jgi:transcriptional regulator with XRE-family HTH domain
MESIKSVAERMKERGVGLEDLLAITGLDRKVLDAILNGRYTPSPQQRQRVASALGVEPGQVLWGHKAQVEHLYGHGPQFGRTP